MKAKRVYVGFTDGVPHRTGLSISTLCVFGDKRVAREMFEDVREFVLVPKAARKRRRNR